MSELENKYIELLLGRCLNVNASKSLLIHFDHINKDFVDKTVQKAKEMGFTDIYLDEDNIFVLHDKLKNSTMEEIEKDPYHNKGIWNVYAQKGANFLMFDTEFPGVMDDIDPRKIDLATRINRRTRTIFRDLEITYQIPWVIAAIPNEIWAKNLFPNSSNPNEELFIKICQMCMADTKDPILSWNHLIAENKKQVAWLNSLNIKRLHYTNSLGTDLVVSLPDNHIWLGVGHAEGMIVNMPSYEIFTSPDYRKTEGIVYSSKPLYYAGGKVDEFFVEFKDGKVINFGAKEGYELLKSIIEGDLQSCYLGEVALVNYDSPISNTGLVFGTTLFDENAACHLAFGNAFKACAAGTEGLSSEELLAMGLNVSTDHVDFMIGTPDLTIEADTGVCKKLIFKHGNFVKENE